MNCTPVSSGKFDFEDIPVFGLCRPVCHDYSLYIFVLVLFVLVLFLDAVVVYQVHVALDLSYLQIVHVYWGSVYNHHLCLYSVLKTHSPTFIG